MSTKTLELTRAAEGSEIGLSVTMRRETTAGLTRSLARRSKRSSVLTIGVPADYRIDGVTLTYASKPADVIEMLRVLDFGLLVVNAASEDREVWKMVQIVRRCWPRLRWVLLSENCTDQQEILARSLGAASVTAEARVIVELAKNRKR